MNYNIGADNPMHGVHRYGNDAPFYGKSHTAVSKEKLRQVKLADKNPMWKGNKVGNSALHQWLKYRMPRPLFCEQCMSKLPIDLANISGQYKRDLTDWQWLCRRCHMISDGRHHNLKQYHEVGFYA